MTTRPVRRCEEEIEELVLAAWRERMVVSVVAEDGEDEREIRPIRIILRRRAE